MSDDFFLLQTPDGSFLDVTRNGYELLTSCGVQLPEVCLSLVCLDECWVKVDGSQMITFFRLAHSFEDMKHTISARWLANSNQERSHFPHNFRISYEFPCFIIKVKISCVH